MTGEIMLRVTVQGTLAVAFVWLSVRMLPGLSPAIRAWLWRLAALKGLLALAGTLAIPLLPASSTAVAAITRAPVEMPLSLDAQGASAQLPIPEPSGHPVDLFAWIWAAGMLVGLVRLALEIREARRIHSDPGLGFECEFASAMGLRKHPKTVLRSDVRGPMLVGVFRPTVILPTWLPDDQRPLAIAHELAHVRRWDLIWALVLRFVSVVFWFVPPVAWAARAAQDASEEACDLYALQVTQADPERYAGMLIDCARSMRAPNALSLGLSSARHLQARIKTMLQPAHFRPRAWHLAALPLLAIAFVPISAAARATEQEPSKDTTFELLQMERYLLNLPSVKRGLKVTPAEEKRMREIWLRSLKQIRALGDKLAALEKKQASNRTRFELEKDRPQIFRTEWGDTLAVLTPEQRARLRQMVLQYNGARTMAYPEVAETMRLSPEKRGQIARLVKAYRDRVHRLQSEVVGPGSDPSRLTSSEQKRLKELRMKLMDVSGLERKQVLNEYWPLFQKTWTRKIVTRAEVQGSSAKQERNRRLSLEEKAKTNAEILALLSPEERQRWRTLVGPKATFDVLPYAWG